MSNESLLSLNHNLTASGYIEVPYVPAAFRLHTCSVLLFSKLATDLSLFSVLRE